MTVSATVSSVVSNMVDYAARIARGEEAVKPGQPLRFTEASSVNDRIWQGDLSITITDNKVPKGMEAIETRVQLVPGNTQGAKHCLDGTAGVEMYAPKGFDWVTPNDDLVGPWMRLTQERTILHPVHGSVTIPAGFCAQIGYQREYDEQLKRERRARD